MDSAAKLKLKIRILLTVFATALFVIGLTALPLVSEVNWFKNNFGSGTFMEDVFAPLAKWIDTLHEAVLVTDENYPFMMYATDWLAFGHFVLAVAFFGAIGDPVRNKWIVKLGMIACICVIPFALICGHTRGIPYYMQFIDCCFGIIGFVPLCFCRRYINHLEMIEKG